MSLLLVQGYDSDNEERILKEQREEEDYSSDNSSGEKEGNAERLEEVLSTAEEQPKGPAVKAVIEKKGKTGLPSAAFAFQEVLDVPAFLRPAALSSQSSALSKAAASVAGITGAHSHTNKMPSGLGAVPNVLPDARGHNSDIYHGPSSTSAQESGRRVPQASLPPKQDAAMLLRLCEDCQVPKTFSSARGGMVCPLCQGRPKGSTEGQPRAQGPGKKREGAVKDKEKLKRMKGQSSHASWKSETEMQLRQTYD